MPEAEAHISYTPLLQPELIKVTTKSEAGLVPFGVIVITLFAPVAIYVNQTSLPGVTTSQVFVELSLVAFRFDEFIQILPDEGSAIAWAFAHASFAGT